jgi:ligand-binding SRPBCC domain-containing protein
MSYKLEFETTIECSVEELFDFHANTHNLPRITPPEIKVEIIKLDEPLKQGSEAILKIKKGLIGFVWELVFEKVAANLIVDRATKSPFKSFVHEHHFIAVDEHHTTLRDIITFGLPLAPLSNPVAWFIKHDMQKMFIYRHQQTLEYFRGEG